MSQYAFYFDGTRCTGCKTCVYACKDKYDLDLGMAYRKVREYGGGETAKNDDGSFTTTCFDYPVSVSCNHCDEPACFSKCPQGAIVKDPDTGFVEVDDEKCIGCGTCVIVCPDEAPKVDEEQKKARKCTACKEIVAGGERDGVSGARVGFRHGGRAAEEVPGCRTREHRPAAGGERNHAEPVRQACGRRETLGRQERRACEPT